MAAEIRVYFPELVRHFELSLALQVLEERGSGQHVDDQHHGQQDEPGVVLCEVEERAATHFVLLASRHFVNRTNTILYIHVPTVHVTLNTTSNAMLLVLSINTKNTELFFKI